jgi:hypothetical protein
MQHLLIYEKTQHRNNFYLITSKIVIRRKGEVLDMKLVSSFTATLFSEHASLQLKLNELPLACVRARINIFV